MPYPIVDTAWLQEHLNDPDLVLLDASMEKVVGKPPIEYAELTLIPNSYQLDLERELVDLSSEQVHAFPTAAQFEQVAAGLGINAQSQVVVYDNQGIYSAPRAWWIFKVMGFDNVRVLDGGLPKWLAEGRAKVHTYKAKSGSSAAVTTHARPELLCSAADILAGIEGESRFSILDARSLERFMGVAPEPRPGVRAGHIPGAMCLPFVQVLDGYRYKTPEQLELVFAYYGLSPTGDLVFSCGSGVTACIILLAAQIAGFTKLKLYDGSWAEWGSDENLPIEA